MLRIALVLLPIAALGAASCRKPAAEAPVTAHGPDAATAPAARADPDVTMRYACEHGHSVAILRGEIARVSLADGRVVEIPRVADSAPPHYSGVALSFDVGSDGATLGQHEVGGFACREAD
jgi:hypothetical protein